MQLYCFWTVKIEPIIKQFRLTVTEDGTALGGWTGREVPLTDAKLTFLGINPKQIDQVGWWWWVGGWGTRWEQSSMQQGPSGCPQYEYEPWHCQAL